MYLKADKMKNVLVIALLVSAPCVFAQVWHAASDTLKSPQSKFHTQVSMSFNNGYDTIRCLYKVSGSDRSEERRVGKEC